MGSEIAILFAPLALLAIFALGYLAHSPRFRVAAILCFVFAAIASWRAIEVHASYSFWTQAGFYRFVFLAACLVLLPVLLGLSAFLRRRDAASGNGA